MVLMDPKPDCWTSEDTFQPGVRLVRFNHQLFGPRVHVGSDANGNTITGLAMRNGPCYSGADDNLCIGADRAFAFFPENGRNPFLWMQEWTVQAAQQLPFRKGGHLRLNGAVI